MAPQTAHTDTETHWYALWIYRNLVSPIITLCEVNGIQCYRPMRLVERVTAAGIDYEEEAALPNLLFVKTSEAFVKELKKITRNRGTAYCYPGTNTPEPIDERAMEIFMLVVSVGARHMEAVDLPIDKGDKVRVIGGIFKGAEGYIRRVHGSKRFVVAIEGIAAIAVTHIPKQFLERIEPSVTITPETARAHIA